MGGEKIWGEINPTQREQGQQMHKTEKRSCQGLCCNSSSEPVGASVYSVLSQGLRWLERWLEPREEGRHETIEGVHVTVKSLDFTEQTMERR